VAPPGHEATANTRRDHDTIHVGVVAGDIDGDGNQAVLGGRAACVVHGDRRVVDRVTVSRTIAESESGSTRSPS